MKAHWPLAAGLAFYWMTTLWIVRSALARTGGIVVYPLDDTYIHMAMARNAALHHVWGATRHAFSSSTSSPLWTATLAGADLIAGARTLTPLILNLVAGSAVVVTLHRWLRARRAAPTAIVVALVALIGCAPLPTLTFLGMEHTAHAALTLWFAAAASAALAAGRDGSGATALAALAAALVGMRYEGLFIVAVAAALFALKRRWIAVAAVVAGASVPVVAYGAWSMWHGWYFLPNSLLLKAQPLPARAVDVLMFVAGSPALHALVRNPAVLLIVVCSLAALLALSIETPEWRADHYALALVAGAALLHAQLAAFGGLYRYEAYLVVAAIGVFARIAVTHGGALWRRRGGAGWTTGAAAAVAAWVVLFPFASRGINGVRNAPIASANIFDQQYQMAAFVKRFYDGRTVALNDIGAVGYLTDARIVDLYGIASRDVAEMKRERTYSSARVADVVAAQGADVALVYTSWFDDYGGVPPAWQRAADWQTPDNVILGGSVVSIFAVDGAQRAALDDHLAAFAGDLPARVTQSGDYTLTRIAR